MSFLTTTNEEGICVIKINRPEKLNAMNVDVAKEIIKTFKQLEKDDKVKVIIITGEGDKAFSAGADLAYMKMAGESDLAQNVQQGNNLAKMYQAIDNCTKPVIVKAHGYAIGGGFGFMVLADIAIAETNAGIIAGTAPPPEVK